MRHPQNHNEEISVYVAGRSDCVNFLYLGLRRRCNSHTNGSTSSHCNAGSPNSDPCAERDSQAYCAPPSYGNSYYYPPQLRQRLLLLPPQLRRQLLLAPPQLRQRLLLRPPQSRPPPPGLPRKSWFLHA